MGACASKRAKHHQLDEVEQKYDVLASLFATRAQDLANIVDEFDASKKAEFLAWEEALEAKEQTKELEVKLAAIEEEKKLEIEEWRRKVEIKDEEIVACHRVVEMRTKERNDARERVAVLEQDLKDAKERTRLRCDEIELLQKEAETGVKLEDEELTTTQNGTADWKSILTTIPWDDSVIFSSRSKDPRTQEAIIDEWEKIKEAELVGAVYLRHMVDSYRMAPGMEMILRSVVDEYPKMRLRWLEPALGKGPKEYPGVFHTIWENKKSKIGIIGREGVKRGPIWNNGEPIDRRRQHNKNCFCRRCFKSIPLLPQPSDPDCNAHLSTPISAKQVTSSS